MPQFWRQFRWLQLAKLTCGRWFRAALHRRKDFGPRIKLMHFRRGRLRIEMVKLDPQMPKKLWCLMFFFNEDYLSISSTFWGSWFWDTLIFECDSIAAFYRCLRIFIMFYWYWCWSLIHEPEFQCPNTSVAMPSCISNTRMRWMPFSTRLVTQRLVGSCVTVTMSRLGNLSWAWLSPSPSQHLGRTWDNIAGDRKKDYDQKVQKAFWQQFFSYNILYICRV